VSPNAKPADVRFYFDADVLGLAKVVTQLRSDVTYPGDLGGVIHRRRRPRCPITTPCALDTAWIPIVAGAGWLIITRDSRIQDHRAEVAAVKDHGAKMVALAGKEALGRWQQLEVLLCQWRAIEPLATYRVCAATAGLGFEIESLDGGAPVQILSEGEHTGLEAGDILVARVVHATSAPTLWGLAMRFEAESERRWRARLAELPANRAQAALIILGFHPDDASEPLPDGLDLLTATSSIDDEDALLDALEDDSRLECIGQTTPHGWAFAWLDHAGCGRPDLGGWREGDGEIEVARVVISEHEMTLISADNETLRTVASHLAETLSDLISERPDALAA